MKKSDKLFVVDALCSDRVVRKAIVLRRPPGKVWEGAVKIGGIAMRGIIVPRCRATYEEGPYDFLSDREMMVGD